MGLFHFRYKESALKLIKLLNIPAGTAAQPTAIPLRNSLAGHCISCFLQFGAIHDIDEDVLCVIVQLMKNMAYVLLALTKPSRGNKCLQNKAGFAHKEEEKVPSSGYILNKMP